MDGTHNLDTELVHVDELRQYHRNPRRGNVPRIRESLRENGQVQALVVNRGELTGRRNEVLGGNHTLQAAVAEGWEQVWVSYVDVGDPEAARIVAALNRTADFGEYDDRLLAEVLSSIDDELGSLSGTGYDLSDLELIEAGLRDDQLGELDSDDDEGPSAEDVVAAYSRKVNAPHYEPNGDNPSPGELVDTSKTEQLQADIRAADLPDDVQDFMLAAAHRHTVFRYDRIAEFYAHADPKLQQLMEASALVIVDFEDAIRHGYVKLTEKLSDLLDADRTDDDAEG